MQTLAWELSYAMRAALKRQKKKKKEEEDKGIFLNQLIFTPSTSLIFIFWSF